MNKLAIRDGRIFLDDKEIQCIEGFDLKSSTGSTAELSLNLIVDFASMSLCQQRELKEIAAHTQARKSGKKTFTSEDSDTNNALKNRKKMLNRIVSNSK